MSEILARIIIGRWERMRAREVCRVLRDEVLREVCGLDDLAPLLRRTALGKPYLEGLRGLHWSSSSCERAVGVAVSTDGPVGFDLESRHEGLIDDHLLRACLTGSEFERWNGACRADPDLFFRLWTRKEAALKCLGCGLHGSPGRTDVGEPSTGWFEGCASEGVFHVRSIECEPGVAGAIASDEPRSVRVEMRRAGDEWPVNLSGCAR